MITALLVTAWFAGLVVVVVSRIPPINPGVVSTTESSRPAEIAEMGTYAAAAEYVPANILRDIQDVHRDGTPHDWRLAYVQGRTSIELCRSCPQSRSV